MKNPTPRMQMIDGFNAAWIDFPDHGAHARKGSIGIDQAIATLVQRERHMNRSVTLLTTGPGAAPLLLVCGLASGARRG